jgi:hypothetical protein
VDVANADRAKGLSKRYAVEVRVPARARVAPHVDETVHIMCLKKAEELLDRPR